MEQSQFNPESSNFDPQILVDSTYEGVLRFRISRFQENPSEDPVHVDQITIHRKRLLNLFNRQIRKHFFVRLHTGPEIALGFPGAHGMALYYAVSLLPKHPGRGQIQQQLSGKIRP